MRVRVQGLCFVWGSGFHVGFRVKAFCFGFRVTHAGLGFRRFIFLMRVRVSHADSGFRVYVLFWV